MKLWLKNVALTGVHSRPFVLSQCRQFHPAFVVHFCCSQLIDRLSLCARKPLPLHKVPPWYGKAGLKYINFSGLRMMIDWDIIHASIQLSIHMASNSWISRVSITVRRWRMPFSLGRGSKLHVSWVASVVDIGSGEDGLILWGSI